MKKDLGIIIAIFFLFLVCGVFGVFIYRPASVQSIADFIVKLNNSNQVNRKNSGVIKIYDNSKGYVWNIETWGLVQTEAISETGSNPDVPTTHWYISKSLWVSLKLYGNEDVTEKGSRIYYNSRSISGIVLQSNEYIEVLTKSANVSIQNAILDIIKKEGKKPMNCIVTEWWDIYYSDGESYQIKNPTADKKYEMEGSRVDQKLDTNAFRTKTDELFEKLKNTYLQECGWHADLILLPRPSHTATFIYNSQQSKTKFIYVSSGGELFMSPEIQFLSVDNEK